MSHLALLLADYLTFVLSEDPIEATRLGVHDYDERLGDNSVDSLRVAAARRTNIITQLEAVDPTSLSADETMDRTVALIDLKTAQRRHEDLRTWARAPYWYIERLGSAYSGLLNAAEDLTPAEQGRRLRARLAATPVFLDTAQQNLSTDAPPIYVEMGITAVDGLQRFLAQAVMGFAETLEAPLKDEVHAEVVRVQDRLTTFKAFLADLHPRAQGHFACGPAHFDFLLREFHLLDFDHQSLYKFGQEQMVKDRAALDAYAHELDPNRSWIEQLETIKANHPRGDAFLDTYHAEMVRARRHCVDNSLITLPAGENAQVVWLPEYLRAGAPLGLMHTVPPFSNSLSSQLLLTPLDPNASAERQEQHMRDNCYAFARSITLHEIYPGHHTQKVHHKLATVNSPVRRYFSSPVFVEGWGLYTEDLMEETGFMDDPAVKLFKLRNALWRSARVVVDSGLHTRNMSFANAVDLLHREVMLDPHMAEGEVRRYTTHNNPTYPSAYLLGKTAIHDLRTRWQAQQGDAFSLQRFHDTLLSYGSPPVKLVAERMMGTGD
jgi:uncharacterized protein (DUF885 family)